MVSVNYDEPPDKQRHLRALPPTPPTPLTRPHAPIASRVATPSIPCPLVDAPTVPQQVFYHPSAIYTADPLDAQCLDSMGLLLGTPSSFRFVPPSICTSPTERVFRRRNHDNAPIQAQPSMTIE
ncbi:hypothetical protein PVK06_043437 [Gossypium arboreum]|uniref:Uncharacterized protein n=1 Tax=Gossypium arboreum TaxID=29729 RepID=A0ABR0MNG6_GOSAR|nr:hypothetical protein PVK06_043437 [Gossypium arboreum]